MNWINAQNHQSKNVYAGITACALTLLLVLSMACMPALAFAEVRKADVIYGQTVDARGLAVAQCPSIDAEYALVMDSEGTVYFERNSTSPIQIASITKIMTAIVALDSVPLDTSIVVSEAAVAVGESSAGLAVGDAMDLETALKALLVPSGNDASVAIAEVVGALLPATDSGDAQDAFIAAMNQKAAEIGCVDTVFENPHGLDDGSFSGNQHSSASDVGKMAQYAMKNEAFRSIVGGGDISIAVDRGGRNATVNLVSTDTLIETYEYAIGIKTGFTALAGPSFAGAANNGSKELYAIVIRSSSEAQRFGDAETLFQWVYDHERDYPLAHSPQATSMTLNGQAAEVPVIAEVAHADWIDKTLKVTLAEPSASIRVFDLNGNVSQSLEFKEVRGNISAGDVVGTITFKQRNGIIATQNLISCEEVAAPDLFEGIGIWWDRLFRGFSGQPQVASSVTLNETPLINDKTAA